LASRGIRGSRANATENEHASRLRHILNKLLMYGLDPSKALVPFSQPGIVTIPLGFAVLIGVSLLTRKVPSGATAST